MTKKHLPSLKKWPYKWVGFWPAELCDENGNFDIEYYRNENWQCPNKDKIIQYLKSCNAVAGQVASIKCPECDIMLPRASYSYDNVWLWPDQLAHEVEAHNIVLPDNFVAHITKNHYTPPVKLILPMDKWPWPDSSKNA